MVNNIPYAVDTALLAQMLTQSQKADLTSEAFKNMLADAMQLDLPVTQTIEAKEPASESEAKTDADKATAQQPEEKKPPEEKPDEQLAMVVAPVVEVMPLPVAEEALVAPAVSAAVEALPIVQEASVPQTQVEQPVEQAPVVQPEAAPTEEVPIVSAELLVSTPEAKPVVAQTVAQATVPLVQSDVEESQQRFDTLVARASEQLQGGDPTEPAEMELVVEQPEETPTTVVEQRPAQPETQRSEAPTQREEEKPEVAAVAQQPQTVADEVPVKLEPVERAYQTPTEQVREQMLQHLEQETMEFRMQLQPEHLGRVDVRMVLEGGKLAVQIIAATPRAAETLRTQTEGLMASMRLSSIQLESVQVVHETQGGEEHMYGAFDTMGGSQQQSDGEPDSAPSSHAASVGTAEETADTPEQIALEGRLNRAV